MESGHCSSGLIRGEQSKDLGGLMLEIEAGVVRGREFDREERSEVIQSSTRRKLLDQGALE